MMEIFYSVLRETFMVSGFVMMMMLVIEYVNVASKGTWSTVLKQSLIRQLLLGTLLGMLPGCLGSFAVVSMFTHGVLGFGALVACMVATMGDEIFVLITMAPEKALPFTLILGATGLIAGAVTHFLFPHFRGAFVTNHWTLHKEDSDGPRSVAGNILSNLRHLSLVRGSLLLLILLFNVAVLGGWFHHGHQEDLHEEAHHGMELEQIINWIFALAGVAAFFLALWVNNHFLNHHWWKHVIMGHFPKIFAWTFGVILVLNIAGQYTEFPEWVRSNPLQMLGLALLTGLIPQSGPHILFVTLFAQGHVPMSILLANSIVQEGHAGLPLLAESKKGFFRMKAISVIIGLFVGILGYFLEF